MNRKLSAALCLMSLQLALLSGCGKEEHSSSSDSVTGASSGDATSTSSTGARVAIPCENPIPLEDSRLTSLDEGFRVNSGGAGRWVVQRATIYLLNTENNSSFIAENVVQRSGRGSSATVHVDQRVSCYAIAVGARLSASSSIADTIARRDGTYTRMRKFSFVVDDQGVVESRAETTGTGGLLLPSNSPADAAEHCAANTSGSGDVCYTSRAYRISANQIEIRLRMRMTAAALEQHISFIMQLVD